MKKLTIAGIILALVLVAAVSVTLAGSRSDSWLGVYTQAVDRDLAEAFSLDVSRGAIINEVVEDSPADEAGLKEDDIIISFDSSRVRDDDDLADLVADTDPGDEVVLTILRDNEEKELQVVIGERPRSRRYFGGSDRFFVPRAPKAPTPPKPPGAPRSYSYGFDLFEDGHPYIGISMIEVSERTARALGADGHGVLIDDVEEDSPAEAAGLQPGDLIIAIDDEETYESSDIQDIIRAMDEGDIAHIEVVRDRDRTTVEVEIEFDEDGRFYGGPGLLRLPDLPAIDFHAPRMRGLHNGHSLDLDVFDSEEFQDEMEKLKRELKKLEQELRELKKYHD